MEVRTRQYSRQLDQGVVVAYDTRSKGEDQCLVNIFLFLFWKADDKAQGRNDALIRRFHNAFIENTYVYLLADKRDGLF